MVKLIAKKGKALLKRLSDLCPPNKSGGLSLMGFTLIELVVTLAILAILVSAAVAALQNITQKAQISQLRATLKSARSAILIQKANNELNNSRFDAGNCHPRANFWPTFEEVRMGSYEGQLSGSILEAALSGNPFINPPARTPPFTNTFNPDCSGNIFYTAPDTWGGTIANNVVVCTDASTPKGTLCPAANCQAGWAYNPYTGAFWANSNQFGENIW